MVSTLTAIPDSPVLIETATWRDLLAVRHVEQACFGKDAWPLLDMIGVLAFPNVVRLKAMMDGMLIGFIASDIRTAERQAWIATIGVLPEYRKQGIGSALLRECEARIDLPSIRLCVRASNLPAIRLYQGFGYQSVGNWVKYYQDGEDALVMEKFRS